MSGSFLKQLKDRQVVQTLVIYVAVSWGFYEIAKEYLVQFGFPEYSPRLLLVLLTLGLPAAVFLAWYFDVDRRGVRAEKRMRSRDWLAVTASILLPITGTLVALPYVNDTSDRIRAARISGPGSVAVLPFTNLTGDTSMEYLGDGIAEEVIGALSQLEGIGVAAQTLSFQYRGDESDLREAGRALAVPYLIRGSVQSAGNQLRLRADLVDAASGQRVWSESADIRPDDLFAAQDQLSRSVAAALAEKLGLASAGLPENGSAPDPEAYDLYLRGRHIWHKRGSVDQAAAIGHLSEAVRVNPDFAKAWAALASAYLTWPAYSREGYATWPLAEDAARKASELDPDLAEPYAVLATFAEHNNNWIEADRLFRDALERDEKHATAHYWYGEHLSKTGRYSDSVRHFQRAIELDPTYLPPQSDLAFAVMHFRDYEQAARRFQSVWDKGYRSVQTWFGRLITAIHQRDADGAFAWIDQGNMPEPAKQQMRRIVTVVVEGASDPQLLSDLLNAPGAEYRFLFWATATLGDYDATFRIARRRLDESLGIDLRPLWGPDMEVREDPRFLDLLEEIGYVDYWQSAGWSDICRRDGDAIVCDSSGMTPEALARLQN